MMSVHHPMTGPHGAVSDQSQVQGQCKQMESKHEEETCNPHEQHDPLPTDWDAPTLSQWP